MWHTVIVTSGKEGLDSFFAQRCPQYYYEPENLFFKSKKDFSNYWFENFGSGIEEAIEGNPILFWLDLNKSQAEIHIQAIAELMWDAINKSTPKELKAGEYHIPMVKPDLNKSINAAIKLGVLERKEFIDDYTEDEINLLVTEIDLKVGVAMAARTSYTVVGEEKEMDYEKMIGLHDKCKELNHSSVFEHCARAMSDEEYVSYFNGKSNENWDTDLVTDDTYEISAQFDNKVLGWCRNFKGFISYRHLIETKNN